MESKQGPVGRTYSANAFKFPSCESCNVRFSELEAAAKPVVSSLLSEDSISATEFSILLDWFDKVRVGLWLSFLYLEKNPRGINPHFHIQNRIGIHDRMLAILKMDMDVKGLNFIGCDMPSFSYTPSCFALRINDYCFLNMSYLHMLSRRIGFPYPIECFMQEDERVMCVMTSGRHRVMMPLLKKVLALHGTELYQPMFAGSITEPGARAFYDTGYVRDHSLSWEEGIGKVFVQEGRSLREYPDSRSRNWVPTKIYPAEVLLFEMQMLTLEWQTHIDDQAPSLRNLSKERKQRMDEQRRRITTINAQLIQTLRRKTQNLGLPDAYHY